MIDHNSTLIITEILKCGYSGYNAVYVTEEDLKLFNKTLLACLYEDTRSLPLLRVARSALQIIKYLSHRHKLHRFEE